MIAGVDYSTTAIDVILLDEDTNHATHHRRRLDTGPGNAQDRLRRVRDAMPSRGAWRDSGVTVIGIEEPFAYGTMKSLPAMLMVLGAIIATLPPELPLALLRADDWRKACGLRIRGQRDELKREAIRFATSRWSNPPLRVDDNIADAFGVAWAARELERKAAAA